MLRYLGWRLVRLILLAWIATSLVFVAFRFTPGDPAEMLAGINPTQETLELMREQLGLNDPVYMQYIHYFGGILHGDFGYSRVLKEGVLEELVSRIPVTLLLLATSIFITTIVGIPAGVFAAVKHGSISDYGAMWAVAALLSIPNFFLGLLLVLLFSVKLGVLPSFGFKGFSYVIMPSFAVAARLIAIVARMTRATTLDVLRENYVQTARAKGLKEGTVIYKHALRNALIPVVTTIGLQMGYLLGGSIVIEVLFSWPGVGMLMMNSVAMRDYNTIQAITIFFAVGFLFINFAVDLLYGFLNPRIRYG